MKNFQKFSKIFKIFMFKNAKILKKLQIMLFKKIKKSLFFKSNIR